LVDLGYNILKESLDLWLAVSPYLLLGMFIAGVVHVFLGREFISRHLSGGPLSSIAKAALFGTPLPLCSCGVIPVAAALRRDGARKSSVLSFLVSTPTTGVDSVLATYSLLGPLFAIFRPLAALVSGIGVGIFNYIVDREGDRTEAASHPHPALAKRLRVKEIFRYGFFELAADIGKWLGIGVIIGGILTAIIPGDLLVKYLPNPGLHFLAMLLVAVPLYVCATGSIPIASALIQKGFSPGAALVFLIAGPATNTVTLSFVYSRLGKRSFYVYLIFIIGISFLFGSVFHLMWRGLGGHLELIRPTGEYLPQFLKVVCGIVLFLLVLNGFRATHEVEDLEYTLHVSGMTCKHCKLTIENGLKEVSGVRRVSVDLDNGVVGIDGDVEIEEIKRAIRDMGYTPEEKRDL